MTLYTKKDIKLAIEELKKTPEYVEVWTLENDPPNLSREAQAFQRSTIENGEVDPAYPAILEYEELEGELLPGSSLNARQLARVINFLKTNGNFSLLQTQDMGNCQYAATQRGTGLKRECSTMHLRRFIVMGICKHPAFFSKYLRHSLSTHFGHARMDPQELQAGEIAGTIEPDYAADQRLPGPFSLVSYCQHLVTDRTWGDIHSLTVLSCLWQIGITVLHTDQLNEHRIRHNHLLPKADLVLVFTGGNHYLGTGEYPFATL